MSIELKTGPSVTTAKWPDEFGQLTLMHEKPLSLMWRLDEHDAVLKLYRQVDPLIRRDREVHALRQAGELGLRVPQVQGIGESAAGSWLVLDLVVGTADTPDLARSAELFVARTLRLAEQLSAWVPPDCSGTGWVTMPTDSPTHSDSPVAQLSEQCREQPWWCQLRQSLKPVDSEPCSYLHGDVKPEHFLRTRHGVCVVDWEATARGPAVFDRADASFHLTRDLVYAGTSLREIPVRTLARLRVPGAVAAWRLLRWLDRRRPGDVALLPGHELRLLLDLTEPTEVARSLAVMVAAMRSVGVPR